MTVWNKFDYNQNYFIKGREAGKFETKVIRGRGNCNPNRGKISIHQTRTIFKEELTAKIIFLPCNEIMPMSFPIV